MEGSVLKTDTTASAPSRPTTISRLFVIAGQGWGVKDVVYIMLFGLIKENTSGEGKEEYIFHVLELHFLCWSVWIVRKIGYVNTTARAKTCLAHVANDNVFSSHTALRIHTSMPTRANCRTAKEKKTQTHRSRLNIQNTLHIRFTDFTLHAPWEFGTAPTKLRTKVFCCLSVCFLINFYLKKCNLHICRIHIWISSPPYFLYIGKNVQRVKQTVRS